MADDFRRYEAMRDAGVEPRAVYESAKDDGPDPIFCIRVLRAVFALPLREAVEVGDVAEEAASDRLAGSLEWPDASSPATIGLLREGDLLSMDQFPLNWRWTDARWNELPPERLAGIRPLVASRSSAIHGRCLACFHALHRRRDLFSRILEYNDSGSDGPEAAREWLRTLAVDEGQAVWVQWGREVAVVTDWATVRDYWDDFCYPMEDVLVRPITEEWILLHRRDERLVFGVRGEGPVAS